VWEQEGRRGLLRQSGDAPQVYLVEFASPRQQAAARFQGQAVRPGRVRPG
jgi:hypothetical protein